MSGNSPCDSSHLDEENVDSKGGNKGWWSTKGKSADGMKGHKGKTGQGKGKTGKGKIDTGDAGPTVKGTGKTGDVLETVKGMGKTGDGVKGAKGKTEDTLETVKGMGKTGDGGVKGSKGKTGDVLETVKGMGKTGDGVKGSKGKTEDTLETVKGMGKTGDGGVKGSEGKTGDTLETVKGMGKTGVKGSEGKTGDTLETVKGMGKTGDGGVKGLGKTGDVGVKGSKGKTNGKTGDKGKTGDLEHIPSASGGPAAPAAEATEPPPVAASPAQLQRSDSSVSINGIMMTAADKTKRVKVLTEEQKHAVLTLTDPSQIPIQERRRQYNAINRRITSSAKSFPPGLVEKWRDADGDSTKKFEFLKCFLVDPSFQSMHIETWFKEQHVKKNTARYVELPLDELEQKFDPEWLKTKVVACQTGKPHPQDPENPRKRLYKVFDRIEESRSDQCSVGSGVHGHADISDNKAHRQAISDVITTKMSTSGVASSLDVLFSGQTSEQQKNKKAKQPKAPKVLSPEEQKKKDFDRSMTQLASLATKARNTAANLTATGIAHQEGLVSTLGKCHHQLNDITYQLNDMVFKGYPLDRLVEALDGHEVAVKDADSRIKDAETIVQSHERRLKAEKRKAEAKGRPQAKGKSKAKRAKKEENTAEIKPEVKAENGEVKDEDDEEEEMDDDLDGEELEDGEWPMDDDLNNVG